MARRAVASYPTGLPPARPTSCSASPRGSRTGALFITEATVKTHINHIFAKTGARDRAQAVHYAYEHGLVAQRPD